MILHIEHTTGYRYADPVSYVAQVLRLTPAEFPGQKVLNWKINAGKAKLSSAKPDAFGNLCHLLTHDQPHDFLNIEVKGEVETIDTKGIFGKYKNDFSSKFYLRQTPQTRFFADLELFVEGFDVGQDPVVQLHELMVRIRGHIDYVPGETDVTTTAEQAFKQGQGVCQDHAHVFVACARRMGVAARYVSGYLFASDDPTESFDAAHAWAEALIPDLGWVGFDVANCVSPSDAYVRLAHGLDYQQAAPVRGQRRGGGEEEMTVTVKVQSAQQQ